MDKTLYSEQVYTPDKIVQFMKKELSSISTGSILHFELYNEKPGDEYEYREHGNDQCVFGNRTGSV